MKGYFNQPFRIDPRLAVENAPESFSTIKDGSLIHLQCKFMLEMFHIGIFV